MCGKRGLGGLLIQRIGVAKSAGGPPTIENFTSFASSVSLKREAAIQIVVAEVLPATEHCPVGKRPATVALRSKSRRSLAQNLENRSGNRDSCRSRIDG